MGLQHGQGRATRATLETLIDRSLQYSARPEFSLFLSETAADVLLLQGDPPGHISAVDAAWLVAKLSQGGGLCCPAQFEMLKRLFAQARSVPQVLTAFAIREIEMAILTGRREIIGGVGHEPAVVTHNDVEALRALSFASAESSLPHVDRGTVEALFDIAHATGSARNDPEFADFFALVIHNHLGACENADWILAHLARGGPLTPAEARLLTLLKVEPAPGRAKPRAPFVEAA